MILAREFLLSIVKNRHTELVLVLFVALTILVFYGSNSEGQSSLFSTWIGNYIEEQAIAFDVSRKPSSLELADLNSLFAGTGGDGTTQLPVPSTDAVTIRDSAVAALMPPDTDYMRIAMGYRSRITEYEVQEGDLLSFIASDFGVSQQTIIWANNLKNADNLKTGQILRIPPVSGVIHKAKSGDTATSLAKKYSADADVIIAYNHLPKDGAIQIDEELIIPDGKPTIIATSKTTTAASSFSHLPNMGDYFRIPAAGFNWRRIHGRNGVDVANSCGTPIYAAAEGTVTVADADGYNGGFGKYIKISHPNGTETLYAHASKLLASVGQVVAKGTQIMLMGTTGRSTGCHLHFEVHGAQNPLAK